MNPQVKPTRVDTIKTLSDKERNEIHQILNSFISKSRPKHFRILYNRLSRYLKADIDAEVVEDKLQDIYLYMYLNPETVKSFNETNSLDRLFNSLAYNIITITNTQKKYYKDLPLDEGFDVPYEEDTRYTVESLNPKLSNEERLEYHRVALDELREYLFDNPHSKLKSALDIIKKDKVKSAYDVALNYVATPSYIFLYKNKDTLGLKHVQQNIHKFKEICSELYGKEIVWNAQSSWKNL